jgi:hypothetical protein
MTISFSVCRGHARYQVRVMRHGVMYSKCFSCTDGKRKAKKAAEEYEKKLIAFLNAEPLTSARRHKGEPWRPTVSWLHRWKGWYVGVAYRRANGHWGRCYTSIGRHGEARATQLSIEKAKRKHRPHPNYVKRRKMPSKQAVRLAVG